MKMKRTLVIGAALLALSTLDVQFSTAHAQGTAFTYQGRLNDGGSPAKGSYDLRFILYDNSVGGNQQGPILTNSATSVSNGLFTVTLDFSNQFSGQARWLDIAVRTNGSGSFFPLTPRQALTPAPYAITAGNVISGGLTAGSYSNAVTFNNAANQFAGAFAGNGANVTNVNAAALDGLAPSSFWQLAGNTVSAGQFLGSVNNQALEIRANDLRAMQLAYASNAVSGYSPNIIGGNGANNVSAGVVGATIGGGGMAPGFLSGPNSVTADFGTVVGGTTCSAQGVGAIAGGGLSTASGQFSVALGNFCNASADFSVALGELSKASGTNSTAFGYFCKATNNYATAMGYQSVAGGFASTAMGNATASGRYSTATGDSTASGSYYTTALGDSLASGDVGATAMGASTASGRYSTAMGGSTATDLYSTALGDSYAYGVNATAMGDRTTASGVDSIAMGAFSTASGDYSFAGGSESQANHTGAFVWADSQFVPFGSSGNDQFLIRAQGGVGIGLTNPAAALHVASGGVPQVQLTQNNTSDGCRLRMNVSGNPFWEMQVTSDASAPQLQFWISNQGGPRMYVTSGGALFAASFNSTSDRNAKENFSEVSPREVLDKVAALPITRWNFKEDKAVEHLGPMAQDFRAAFGVGTDDKHIATVDEEGVALAAIQGLNQKLEEQAKQKDAEIQELKQRLEALEQIILKQKAD
jgi:trimeric autotransporter adhesin